MSAVQKGELKEGANGDCVLLLQGNRSTPPLAALRDKALTKFFFSLTHFSLFYSFLGGGGIYFIAEMLSLSSFFPGSLDGVWLSLLFVSP